MKQQKARILLVDDHPIVRSGFRRILEDNYTVDEADSAEAAYKLYRAQEYDVVVMDLAMPGKGGIEGMRNLFAYNEKVKVIVLSMRDDPITMTTAIKLGARGFLSKNCEPSELNGAIKTVLNGKKHLPKGMPAMLLEHDLSGLTALTNREFQIFIYLANGDSVHDISCTLNRSKKTISNHRSQILAKLHAKNSTELAHIAFQHGVLKI